MPACIAGAERDGDLAELAPPPQVPPSVLLSYAATLP
jgi:hypothetical protein